MFCVSVFFWCVVVVEVGVIIIEVEDVECVNYMNLGSFFGVVCFIVLGVVDYDYVWFVYEGVVGCCEVCYIDVDCVL